MKNILVSVFLLGFLESCSSVSEQQPKLVDDPNMLLKEVLTSENNNIALEGNASLNIETKLKGQKFSCKMTYNSRDTIKLAINTGFGYGLVTIWLTPDSFFVSNRLTKQFISSSYRSNELEELLGFPFAYSDIEMLFLGKLTINNQFQLTKTLMEPQHIVYVFRGLEGAEKIWVSRSISKVSRIQKTDRKGRVVLDISLDRYKEIEQFWFAHQIQVYKPDDGQKLSLYFSSLEKIETGTLKIEVPDNMERISF